MIKVINHVCLIYDTFKYLYIEQLKCFFLCGFVDVNVFYVYLFHKELVYILLKIHKTYVAMFVCKCVCLCFN